MPPEERTSRSADRCGLHPGSAAVARCDGCGRPLCLSCAVPVRGKAFGAECLAEALGSEVAPEAVAPARPPGASARRVARAAFAAAAVATLVPWSRFGPGSSALGAWSRHARWSTVAVVAALAGLALSVALRSPWFRARGWQVVAGLLAGVTSVASALFIAWPPDFSSPWLGPWIAAVSGGMACAASFVALRGAREPERVSV